MSRSGTDLREVHSVTIKVTKFVEDIFPEYRPTVGAIYEADYTPPGNHARALEGILR